MHGTSTPVVPGLSLLRRVSRDGGPTEVWEARDEGGARVAVKLLRSDRAPPDQVIRFHHEGELLERLGGHHHVVHLQARIARPPALVFAWAAGGSLRDRIHPAGSGAPAVPLAPHRVRRIGLDLCDALTWLHECGVYHRDVKPSNVLLDQDGRALLADFGIAARGSPPRSMPAGWVEEEAGTLGYAAPELLRDPGAFGVAIDIYGLGCTLYEALSGRLPHDMRPADSERSLRWRLARGESPVPLASRGWVGARELAAVVERAISPDPWSRQPSAAALRSALETAGGMIQ